jgi:hypothetical protein
MIVVYILLSVLSVILVLLIISQMLDRSLRIEKEIIIKKTAQDIFPYVSCYKKFVQWNPLSKKDPNIKQEFSGEEMGVGEKYSWSGNNDVKTGEMLTTAITPNTFIRQKVDFGRQGTSYADFNLIEKDGKTTVIWGFDMDFGSNPFKRLLGPMIKGFVGKDYDAGLQSLKNQLEKE